MKVVQQRSSNKILKTPFANLSNFLGDPRAQHLEVYLAHVDLRRELWREFHLGEELLLLRLEAPILIHAHPSETVSHLAASKHASCQTRSTRCRKIVHTNPLSSLCRSFIQLQHIIEVYCTSITFVAASPWSYVKYNVTSPRRQAPRGFSAYLSVPLPSALPPFTTFFFLSFSFYLFKKRVLLFSWRISCTTLVLLE